MNFDDSSNSYSASDVQSALLELMHTHNFYDVLHRLQLSDFDPSYVDDAFAQQDIINSRWMQAVNDHLNV